MLLCGSIKKLAISLLLGSILLLGHPAASAGDESPEIGVDSCVRVNRPETPAYRIHGSIFVETRELRAESRLWKFRGPATPKAIITSGDFNCDGADDLFVEDSTGQPMVAISDGKRSFVSRAISGIAREALLRGRWREASSFDPERTKCDLLLVPEEKRGAIQFGSPCEEKEPWNRIEWSERVFSRTFGLFSHAAPQVLGIIRDQPFRVVTAFFSNLVKSRSEGGHPESYTLVAADNFHGLEDDELLYRYQSRNYITSSASDTTWGELPANYDWRGKELVADFTGDGRADVLTEGEGIAGKWLIRSFGNFGVERPLPLPSAVVSLSLESAGDFDGDGFSEAVAIQPGGFLVLSLVRPQVVPEPVKIRASNGVSTLSREDGAYQLESDTPLGVVSPASDVSDFSPSARAAYVASRSGRPLHFFKVWKDRDEVGGAFDESGTGPYVCTGTQIAGSRWGRVQLCPDGYAFQEVDDSMGFRLGTCCRLPRADILLKAYEYAKDACPSDSIVTGLSSDRKALEAICPSCDYVLRCTKINTAKFGLSKPTPGRYYGTGVSGFMRGLGIQRNELPVAIRSGMGRVSLLNWDVDGCLGKSAGMLMVAAKGKRCDQVEFSTLQEKESKEDIVMFPRCREMVDIFDATAGCRPEILNAPGTGRAAPAPISPP